MIGRILLTLGVLAVTGFVLLVLIGFWDRHEQEITASLSRIYDRYLALQAGFPSNPRARAGIEPERARAAGRGQVATTQTFQQQPKLVGTGAVGSSNQGMSVALSVDGNTAIVGGPGPNNADRDRPASRGPAGAAWVFTRNGAVWRQQAKLVGTTSEYGGGLWSQGASVAVSADGNTAIVGGPGADNADRDRPASSGPAGAAWVFTRSGGVWRQQGGKLVGTTSEYGGGLWSQGASVAVSADGNIAIVGGPSDNRATGAAWVFTRSGDVWTQQGNKLVGSRAGEQALPLGQGMSVALSADGNTAIVGGWGTEAAWRLRPGARPCSTSSRPAGR